jgi:hypothetical protein
MIGRVLSTSKIFIPTMRDNPYEWKFIDGRLERMMDHAVITIE